MDQSQKLVDKVNELFFTAKSLWIDKDFKGDVKVQLGEADIRYYNYFLDSIKELYQRIKGEIREKYVKVFKEKNKDLIDLYELKGGDISEIIEIPILDLSVTSKMDDKKYVPQMDQYKVPITIIASYKPRTEDLIEPSTSKPFVVTYHFEIFLDRQGLSDELKNYEEDLRGNIEKTLNEVKHLENNKYKNDLI